MSAIDSQYEEPFDDESDFSEPELSDADGQDRGRGENRKCQPEEDGQEQSARWYFEGTFFLTIDLDDFQDQVPEPAEIKLHFREAEYYNKPPFHITSMKIHMDFSKARVGGVLNNIFTAPINGLVHSQSIGADTLKRWFEPFVTELNVRAIPCSRMLEELRKIKTELTAANQAGSNWQVVASLGRRNTHRLFAKNWRFTGSFIATSDVLARARASADDDILAIARQAFETAVPPDSHPSGIRFMAVFGDLQPLYDGESGSVTIQVKGYIQSTHSELRKFLRWQPTFAWDIVRGGLVGSAEFESDRAAARLDAGGSSPLFEIYTVGTLGLNNAGRMQAKQASARHSIQSRCPAPLTLCRAGTRRARGRRLPRRRLGGLLLLIRAHAAAAALSVSGEFALSWLRCSTARWPQCAPLPRPRRGLAARALVALALALTRACACSAAGIRGISTQKAADEQRELPIRCHLLVIPLLFRRQPTRTKLCRGIQRLLLPR